MTQKVCDYAKDERFFKFERTVENQFVQQQYRPPLVSSNFRPYFLLAKDSPALQARLNVQGIANIIILAGLSTNKSMSDYEIWTLTHFWTKCRTELLTLGTTKRRPR